MKHDRICALQSEIARRKARKLPTEYLERVVDEEIDFEAQRYPEGEGLEWGGWAVVIATTLIVAVCLVGLAYRHA